MQYRRASQFTEILSPLAGIPDIWPSVERASPPRDINPGHTNSQSSTEAPRASPSPRRTPTVYSPSIVEVVAERAVHRARRQGIYTPNGYRISTTHRTSMEVTTHIKREQPSSSPVMRDAVITGLNRQSAFDLDEVTDPRTLFPADTRPLSAPATPQADRVYRGFISRTGDQSTVGPRPHFGNTPPPSAQATCTAKKEASK
jgi:hypothetical protein